MCNDRVIETREKEKKREKWNDRPRLNGMEEEMRRVCVSMNVRKKDPHVPSASKDFLDLRASKR